VKALKVAIVHDWLVGGGAERVVYELHQIFPEAPIYTSYCNDEWRAKMDGKVITGFLQNWPFSKLRKLLPPLRIWWITRLNLTGYELIISSSGAEAKGIKNRKWQKADGKWVQPVHINYCHAPTHYYWSRYEEYLANPGWGVFNSLGRFGLRLLVGPLRKWDYKAAQRPDHIIANSTHTQTAVKTYYGRDSVVIHPPVDTLRFQLTTHDSQLTTRTGFVIAGRQTPYKRVDLAVAACTLLGVPLTVIGNGPDHQNLKSMAGPTITFVTNATDVQVAQYFAQALGFIFPGIDDFGITPVEAMAAGTPVIAYKAGGALDYITPKTGLFFEHQTTDSLQNALKRFNSSSYNTDDLQAAAKKFSNDVFRKNIRQEIGRIIQ